MLPCTGASELHSDPARAIGSRVTTRSCAVRAHHEPLFGDLSAPAHRLALGREVRARLPPREGTGPFLARSGKSPSSPTTHASLPLPLPPYPVLACDTLRPHAPRLSSTLAGGPIRRATPCVIIAGDSGARATAVTASPHALWPAAARRTAPYSSPPADWDDPWRCCIAGSGRLGPAPVNTRLGDATRVPETGNRRGIARLLSCVGRGVCRDFMGRKCSEEVIRGGPALLSVGTDIPERAGARGRFFI